MNYDGPLIFPNNLEKINYFTQIMTFALFFPIMRQIANLK